MMTTVLSISVAYVMVAVLLLIIGLTSRIHWRWKALVIIGTTFFFVSVFFQTRNLLGWPSNTKLPIPAQLLWARVLEPNRMAAEPGAIFMWVEQLDENNIPVGMPRAYRLPYTRILADKTQKARDNIMDGKPISLQEDPNAPSKEEGNQTKDKKQDDKDPKKTEQQGDMQASMRTDDGTSNLDMDQMDMLKQLDQIQFAPMPPPLLPTKELPR
jgi:hypothetical protein